MSMPNLFLLPDRPGATVSGSDRLFPVRRIFCVGRNYAEHAREMGMDPDRDPPFFFTKFAEALVPGGGTIPYPPQTSNYHFEAELVVAIDKEGVKLDSDDALNIVFGYAAGLDMTRRDRQFEAREKGRPWDIGKNFAWSAPIAEIRPVSVGGHAEHGVIELKVNGVTRQKADLADLTWSTAELIAELSRFERLLPGDLIFTGTPAGVGAVVPGDNIVVTIEGLPSLNVQIGPPENVP